MLERYTISWRGDLVIMDVTDQGLRRPVKVARLSSSQQSMELVEPHILWVNGDRFVLAGFERCRNEHGQQVDYAQS